MARVLTAAILCGAFRVSCTSLAPRLKPPDAPATGTATPVQITDSSETSSDERVARHAGPVTNPDTRAAITYTPSVTANMTSVTPNTVSVTPNTVSETANTPPVTANTSSVNSNTISVTPNTTPVTANMLSVTADTTSVTAKTTSVTHNTTSVTAKTTSVTHNTTSVTANPPSVTANTNNETTDTSLEAADKSFETIDTNIETADQTSVTADTSIENSNTNIETNIETADANIETADTNIEPNDKNVEPRDTNIETADQPSVTADTNIETADTNIETSPHLHRSLRAHLEGDMIVYVINRDFIEDCDDQGKPVSLNDFPATSRFTRAALKIDFRSENETVAPATPKRCDIAIERPSGVDEQDHVLIEILHLEFEPEERFGLYFSGIGSGYLRTSLERPHLFVIKEPHFALEIKYERLPKAFSMELRFSVIDPYDNVTLDSLASSVTGLVRTPLWDGLTAYLYPPDQDFLWHQHVLKVPEGHHAMVSWEHVGTPLSEDCDHLQVFVREPSSWRGTGGDDPLRVWGQRYETCGPVNPLPRLLTWKTVAFQFLSDFTFAHQRASALRRAVDCSRQWGSVGLIGSDPRPFVQVRVRTGHHRGQSAEVQTHLHEVYFYVEATHKKSSTPVFTGYSVRFSFHNTSAVPQQLADRTWNCSVPHWPDFKQHLQCNLFTECAGGEDEADCVYTTTGTCRHGYMAAGGSCFTFEHNPQTLTSWAEAETACRSRGARLPKLQTPAKWRAVLDLLSHRGWENIYIGLSSGDPSLPDLYRHVLQWTDTSVAYYVKADFILEFHCTACAFLKKSRRPDFVYMDSCFKKVPASVLCEEVDEGSSQLQEPYFKKDICVNAGHPLVNCEHLRMDGACNWDERYMRINCRKECGMCGDDETSQLPDSCINDADDYDCTHWARGGECLKNQDYMRKYCKRACRHCDPATSPPPENKTPSRFNSTRCPKGHVTHNFLSCDTRSDCFSRCYNSFSAPMVSLPPAFQCHIGLERVSFTLVCDHREDCTDGSDEICVFPPCQEFACNNKQCVARHKTCNGLKDCLDGSDEMACGKIYSVRPSMLNFSKALPAMVLHDGKGSYDLLDIADPSAQSTSSSDNLPSVEGCPDSHFQCPGVSYYCLPVYVRCNGVHDCPGHQDEAECENATCPGFYRCRGSKVCLHSDHVCDGVFQCPLRDDELMCGFVFPVGCTCYGLAFFCTVPLDSSRHVGLRFLDASGSGMRLKGLSNNNMLFHLNLAKCNITQLEPMHLMHVFHLDLSGNDITTLTERHVSSFPNLQVFIIAGNPLRTILQVSSPGRSASFAKLHTLDLSAVPITAAQMVNLHVFPNVRNLNLSDTGLDAVSGFSVFGKLQMLDLRGCSLTYFTRSVFQGLDDLSTVYADNYKLCCPETLPDGFNMRSCHAPFDEVSSCEGLLKSGLYRVGLSVLTLMTLIGNAASFVYRVFINRPKQQASFWLFVTNLCVSDFLMGSYSAIIGVADRLYLGNYVWNDVTWMKSVSCKMAGVLSLLSNEVSVLIICLITIDRFLVTRFPFSLHLHFSPRSARVACVTAWTIGVLLAVAPLLPMTSHWELYSQTGLCIPLPVTRKWFAGRDYSFAILIILNFVLFLVIAGGQMSIYLSIRANSMAISDTTQKAKDLTIARRLITVAVSDFLCWFPVGLLGLMSSRGQPVPGEASVVIAVFVLPLNSALNPFLYTVNVILERRQRAREQRLQKIILARHGVNQARRDGEGMK